ncbi:BtrH N-terminal domain-containing protein [Anaerocolumna jejuensis]|uniref:BtrH N-terminal domain-containing protein n=1 Tax=Anaerocolumna jejuensis TaxID=259063 RepID=UPI003F7BFDA2
MKTLVNVNAFNDIYYINCFYNALFTGVIFHNEDIWNILSSGVAEYKLDLDRKRVLRVVYDKEYDKKLLEEIGLYLHTNEEEVFGFIKKAIDNNNPVIMNIDWFYIPHQKAVYQKEHRLHSILVNGYCEQEQKITIIDQKYTDTLIYDKFTLSFEDLNKAHLSYLEIMKEYKVESLFEVKKLNNTIRKVTGEECRNKYIRNMRNNNYYINRVHVLDQVLDNFDEVYKKITFDRESLLFFIDFLNDIVNHKRTDQYIGELYMKMSNEILHLNKEIESIWNKVRELSVKSMLKKDTLIDRYKYDIYDYITEIYNKEKELIELLKRSYS